MPTAHNYEFCQFLKNPIGPTSQLSDSTKIIIFHNADMSMFRPSMIFILKHKTHLHTPLIISSARASLPLPPCRRSPAAVKYTEGSRSPRGWRRRALVGQRGSEEAGAPRAQLLPGFSRHSDVKLYVPCFFLIQDIIIIASKS